MRILCIDAVLEVLEIDTGGWSLETDVAERGLRPEAPGKTLETNATTRTLGIDGAVSALEMLY